MHWWNKAMQRYIYDCTVKFHKYRPILLTHCRLNRHPALPNPSPPPPVPAPPYYILEESSFKSRYVGPCDLDIPREKWLQSGDPDQTPCSAESDLGLHCFPITLLGSPDYNGFTITLHAARIKFSLLCFRCSNVHIVLSAPRFIHFVL